MRVGKERRVGVMFGECEGEERGLECYVGRSCYICVVWRCSKTEDGPECCFFEVPTVSFLRETVNITESTILCPWEEAGQDWSIGQCVWEREGE